MGCLHCGCISGIDERTRLGLPRGGPHSYSLPGARREGRGLVHTTVSADRKKSRASRNYRDVLNSVLVVAIIALVVVYFSG